MKYRVYVFFKNGILDPEAEAIKKTLHTSGFKKIKSLKKGKFFDIVTSGKNSKDEISSLSEKILSNPIIENSEIKKIDN